MQLQQNPGFILFNSATNSELKQLTEMYPWFQLGWLFYLKSLKKDGAPEFGEVLKKVAVIIPNQKVVTDFLNDKINEESPIWDSASASSAYLQEEDGGLQQSDSLIDRFLLKPKGAFRKSHGEKTERPVDFVNPEEQSLAESDEMITETLAKIYFDQKKYEKAMKAYEKLSLKYPEKSIYFASQIEKIEKLKDNNS